MQPRGRHDAGDSLLRAYTSTLAGLLSALARMLGSREDALDAAQTAFLKCWRSRASLADVRDLKAWVFRVGLNVGRDLRRDPWRRRLRPLMDAPTTQCTTSRDLLRNEALDRLNAAIAGLRPSEREVFLLRQHGDRTYDEIAALCCIPVGTVKTRMRVAILKLRAELLEKGDGHV
jgi:RNA polymerase sigma-70 factor (ECF subfamily)